MHCPFRIFYMLLKFQYVVIIQNLLMVLYRAKAIERNQVVVSSWNETIDGYRVMVSSRNETIGRDEAKA